MSVLVSGTAHGGWGMATRSRLQAEDPQHHPFIYVFAVRSDQRVGAWLFPRQGEGGGDFAHVKMLVLPLKSPDELVLCKEGLKSVRGQQSFNERVSHGNDTREGKLRSGK